MKRDGVEVRNEWIRPEVLTFKIPSRILEVLGISQLSQKKPSLNHTFDGLVNHTKSRSPAYKIR